MPKPLKILMLCWEYPPVITGGLGNACAGLSRALVTKGHQVDVLLPKVETSHESGENLTLMDVNQVRLNERAWTEEVEIIEQLKELRFGFTLVPYMPPKFFEQEVTREIKKTIKKESKEVSTLEEIVLEGGYGEQLMAEIHKYAVLAAQRVMDGDYDVIHVHDWMTFKAGSLIQKISDTPVIFQVHSVESDRNGLGGNPEITQIEKEVLTHARYIVTVSGKLQQKIAEDYGIAERKIEVVPNGISGQWKKPKPVGKRPKVGFIGRLTHQKGPSYFLDIARELRSKVPGIEYYVIGDGYLKAAMQEKAKSLNLSVVFTGFLQGEALEQARRDLDLLIAPSMSEPFGLVILETLQAGIPAITSLNTGISEFIPDLPQFATWDTYQLTQQAQRLLFDDAERTRMIQRCQQSAKALSWEVSAQKTSFLYEGLINR